MHIIRDYGFLICSVILNERSPRNVTVALGMQLYVLELHPPPKKKEKEWGQQNLSSGINSACHAASGVCPSAHERGGSCEAHVTLRLLTSSCTVLPRFNSICVGTPRPKSEPFTFSDT